MITCLQIHGRITRLLELFVAIKAPAWDYAATFENYMVILVNAYVQLFSLLYHI
jgi:hypothetical protein